MHCLNSLLQGPFINEVSFTLYDKIDLSKIALELDEKEKTLMSVDGTSEDLLKYLKVIIIINSLLGRLQ